MAVLAGLAFAGLMAGFWTYFSADLVEHIPELVEPGLRREEADPQQKSFQKVFGPITIAAFALTGLDFRFEMVRGTGSDPFQSDSC